MRSDLYQYTLIGLGVAATVMMGAFWHRELFPEYKIYQNHYIALEEFRATYTGEPPPPFQSGIKQIVMEREDKGPAAIDRCISCHVALEFAHFSPTKIVYDKNGIILRNAEGEPLQEPNENYVWRKLDEAIAALTDSKTNQELIDNGKRSIADAKLAQAQEYKALKTAEVGEHLYDVTKVLKMHPLMGKETRPFEFHPVAEYGCVSCHGGNGRGLTTDKAHGPVFDGQYEQEFEGPKRVFTENDPDNDPLFAKVYNGKPTDKLVFQTTPLLVGPLIQARCINCHQTASEVKLSQSLDPTAIGAMKMAVDKLTKNYQRGEDLFISQACYACHRIAGFARGGVGPELTKEGNSYPWFIKESIVWPQADLPTSTMPNYKLDHEEVQDLMAFLLGQKGQRKAVAETAYKESIKAWEEGRKAPWEKPVTPKEIHDLRYGMTVFATEGCSACHRLKGFESDVGYRIEKEGKPDWNSLYKEREWFTQLIPEAIEGSQLVDLLEKHSADLDARIADHVRQGSILEEIESRYPGEVESLYTPFKYALRAKNHYYHTLASDESNPVKKQEILAKLDQWKQRIHRTLMMYIQEYGLGRLIGPRPNWSGVYHSDQWLMEHFRNPSEHIPRSIMPVFPFDDTKFYALTMMLDALGRRNRDEVRSIWEHRGFNPQQAYQLLCSQCHGPFLQGNGPVAEWIYPVPKNLRNADFLRNLTRERVSFSIAHGVDGTPMSAWGEAPNKGLNPTPVLSASEIDQLTDWIFSFVPGSTVIKSPQDVPKWNYTPADIHKELQEEGSRFEGALSPKHPLHGSLNKLKEDKAWSFFSSLGADEGKQKQIPADDIFDVSHSSLQGPDEFSYHIKKKYYTPENIEQGRLFFELNCAVCHGKEADGTGGRSEAMKESKPRMLTNLDWSGYRDDLRFLRSIKYGVAGTSMPPWGDQTNALQRLQLVVFIRSLTEENRLREELLSEIYRTFDASVQMIDDARGAEYARLMKAQKKYDEAVAKRKGLYEAVQEGNGPQNEAVDAYRQEIEALAALNQLNRIDQAFLDLKSLVAKEKQLYQNLGFTLLKTGDEEDFHVYLRMINAMEGRYKLVNGQLHTDFDASTLSNSEKAMRQIMEHTEDNIKKAQAEIIVAEGKFPSTSRSQKINEIHHTISSYTKLKNEIASSLQEAAKLREQEQALWLQISQKEPLAPNSQTASINENS